MNVRGRHVCIKLIDPIVPKVRIGSKKALCKYKFKINNASYMTITNKSVVGAQRIADRNAKRSKYNKGSAVLFSITKIFNYDK